MTHVASELRGTQYRAVFDAAPDGIVIVDRAGQIRDVNPQAERLFGYAREELIGEGVETLVPEARRDEHRRHRGAYMSSPRTRPMGVGLELTGRRKDGRDVPVEISLSPMPGVGGTLVVAVVRDMTERNKLRTFGATALQAAEDERTRIARELHDDTAQRLAALLMRLRVLSNTSDASQREELLDRLHDEVLETAEGVRAISRGLRPPALEEIGIVPAVRGLARTVQETHDLEVRIDAPHGDFRLSPDAELAVYRIVQEALSNVVRHAAADRVQIRLHRDPGRLAVEVQDDGRGFDPETSADAGGRGLGLLGMRERARLIGGRIEVRTATGHGTTIRLDIPHE